MKKQIAPLLHILKKKGPLTIADLGRTDSDTGWLTFNLSSANEVTFTDLRSGFSETFDLDLKQSTWLSDDDSGHGHAGNRAGLITARATDGSYVCGQCPPANWLS